MNLKTWQTNGQKSYAAETLRNKPPVNTTVYSIKHESVLMLFLRARQKNIYTCKIPSSGHEVRPINDLHQPHDCILLVLSLMVIQVVFQ
jgi:hypothetical protein